VHLAVRSYKWGWRRWSTTWGTASAEAKRRRRARQVGAKRRPKTD